MKRGIIVLVLVGFVVSGCSRNPTLRQDIKKNIERQTIAGVNAFRRGDLETSLVFFQDALNQAYVLYLPQEMMRQYTLLAEVSLQIGDREQAFTYWQSAEKIANQEGILSFDLWLVKARYFQMVKNLDQAGVCYQTALRISRTTAEKILVRIYYADFLLEQHKLSEAKKILQEAGSFLWFFSDYDVLGFYHYYRGVVARQEGNYEEALQQFRKALEYDQKAENTRGIKKDLGQILDIYKLKNEDAQVAYYQELLKKLLDKNQTSR